MSSFVKKDSRALKREIALTNNLKTRQKFKKKIKRINHHDSSL